MKAENESYYYLADIGKSISAYFRFTFRRWYLILMPIVIGAALGFFFHFRQKPSYRAETTFILEEKASAGGGLSGLASQFGIDVGSLGGGRNLFSGDNLFDILKSRTIVYKVLLSKVKLDSSNQEVTLADLFLDVSEWKKDKSSKQISFTQVTDEKSLSIQQDSILNEIHGVLVQKAIKVERYNKSGSIIRVQVTSANPTFARQMTNRLVEEAANLYLNIKTGTAQANIAQMQRRSDSILLLLNRKSYASAASAPLDLNPGIKTAVVPGEIISRDKGVLSTLYAELTRNLEASKLMLSQQTPVFQLLDGPSMVLKDQRKGWPHFVLAGVIGCEFIVLLIGLFMFIYKGVKAKSSQYNPVGVK